MKNNNFLKGTIILCLGGFIVKILGFIVKILYTRILGTEGIALYTLIMPTYSLLVTVAGFGMPQGISKLISEGKIRSKKIIEQSIIFLVILNFIVMIIVILSSDFISTNLLHEPRTKVLLIGCTLSMPSMALACTLKGYFYGKQNMLPNNISNIVEQSIRILFVIFILPKLISKSLTLGVLSFLLINFITETASIITFLFLLPKNIKIDIRDISYDKDTFKRLMNTTTPLVSSRIIGNIGYFFEPIILSSVFLYLGYEKDYFVIEYGIYNSYSLAILLMPSFLIQAICTSIIPEVSKFYTLKRLDIVKKRCKEAIYISSLIGLITVVSVTTLRDNLLNLIYGTSKGSNYVLALSIFFTFYYLEAPISSILQGLGHSNFTFKTTIYSIIIKLSSMVLFTLITKNFYGLIISEAIDIFFIVLRNGNKLKSILQTHT